MSVTLKQDIDTPLQIQQAGKSDVGRKRSHNEDFLLIKEDIGLFIDIIADRWAQLAESDNMDAAKKIYCFANRYIQALPESIDDIYIIVEALQGLGLESDAIQITERYINHHTGQLASMSVIDHDLSSSTKPTEELSDASN